MAARKTYTIHLHSRNTIPTTFALAVNGGSPEETITTATATPVALGPVVATVLAETPADALALADYIWMRVSESSATLLHQTTSNKGQLLRGLLRRYVHLNYVGSAAVSVYPPCPEYLSDEGETEEDDE